MDSTSDGRYNFWPERRIVVVADATFDAQSLVAASGAMYCCYCR
jgi:hypothetical protein